MDLEDHVSLIDLSKQLPFEIDQSTKQKICFGETLIISCGHYEGDLDYEEESSESEWSCEESSEPTVEEEEKGDQPYEIKDYVAEESAHEEEEEEEDDDFSFYFFPDCEKPPPPQNSKSSLIVVDGLPKLNLTAKKQKFCVCKKDKTGECPCYTKVPCKCGAKTLADCTCSKLKKICVCTGLPRTECKCKNCNVCVCDPDGRIFPKCTCANIEKPCICHPGKFPSPVCKCKYKPKFLTDIIKTKEEEVTEAGYEVQIEARHEGEEEGLLEEGSLEVSEREPCICQKPDPKKLCYCLKGKDCTCLTECVCGVQRPCLCQPEESEGVLCDEIPCKINDDRISTCSCDAKRCTCDYKDTGAVCKCFPVQICTCGDPEKCKCFTTCDCTDPCLCDTVPVKPQECICLKPSGIPDFASRCTCIQEPAKKQKKVRAGKQGYRWCHEVPPDHTYFDYAYGRQEKIAHEDSTEGKFEIQGLHDEQPDDVDTCPIHGVKTPKFEKKARKPSLDCCSAVGGISICVESLGEDKDKLLVQVVSYSSKEGAKTGSKLVSILDCNLHTMEENRVEHITKKDLTKERRCYTAICESGYYNKVTRICGDKHVAKRFYHSFEKAHNFLLEGSNIVFMRYLALRRFKGTVQTDTVMMDGTICRSIYVCKGGSQGIVNANPFFVVKVERHIIEPSGYVHQTLTVLSLKGYIISHEWADNCYIFHINPLLRVFPDTDEIEQHEPLRETWRNDLQLMSDFLDFKEPCICQKPDPKKLCYCLKGKDCTCLTECVCGVQRPCLCQPEESEGVLCDEIPCKINDDRISTCSCDAKRCTCDYKDTGAVCKCFPVQICTCGDPEKCKCFTTCDCTDPCLCDTVPVKPQECICLKPSGIPDFASRCTCIQEPAKKQKKVRAGKQGYRWCHEVPPDHTYFDYAYGRQEKIAHEDSTEGKFEIQGLHDEQPDDVDTCPIHGVKTPKFEKKARKPSLDCCSAVGGISICVESLGEDKDKLLVQVVSYSSKEGAKTGSKLVSILDCNLHTMEENRVEHITKKDLTKERRCYTAICESGYYNKVTRICGDKHVAKRFYHSFEKAHNFLLEGSNIVFMRYLALRRFKGTVQTDTVMMDGTICRSIYVCKGGSQGIVNANPFFVVKVERHIIEPSGYVHQTLTVLSLKGYIISHEWADNCYIFHINPLLRVFPDTDEIEQHEPLRETWRNDLQLMSDFLDFKSTRVSEGGRYVTESGTLTGTVRDYLQAILLLRPEDTIHFTRHYFSTVLSALDLPHDEFFDPTSKHVRYYFFEE